MVHTNPAYEEEKPEPYKSVCVYEIQDWVFHDTREVFKEAVKLEIERGGIDMLTHLMEVYDARKNPVRPDTVVS